MAHPAAKIPDNPHGQMRYESAKIHAAAAEKAGKSSEEIHAIFQKVIDFDAMDIASIPTDEAHAKYRDAMIHVKSLKEKGATDDEIHAAYRSIMNGTGKHHS